jgi:group I intron endonuclease
LRNNKHQCKTLQNAFNKYGEEAFVFFIESVHKTRDEAYDAEQRWLDQFYGKRCCYNENPLATKPPDNTGKRLPSRTKEWREKQSKSHLGHKPTQETRIKMSLSRTGDKNHHFGKFNSLKTRQKISESLRGKKFSEERKAKLKLRRQGEDNPSSILNKLQVNIIRKCLDLGITQQFIADIFQISQVNISRIKNGKIWKH